MEYEPKALVRSAFQMAFESGKTGWTKMSIAVLKNRLLILTKREFSESKFGVKSFSEFLASISDLITVDSGFVLLSKLEAERISSSAKRPIGRARLREDIWIAMVDYASGKVRVWTKDGQVAEAKGVDGESVLPTISRDDMRSWRREFLDSQRKGARFGDLLSAQPWADEVRPTALLTPPPLRVAWNEDLKRRIVMRLEEWFRVSKISVPADLLVDPARTRVDSSVPTIGTDTNLREFLIECIKAMTIEELARIQVPAHAAFRARLKG